MTHTIFLIVHIAAGTVALLAGAVAIYAKKGGKLHVRLGKVFVISMLLTAIAALILSAIKPNPFLMGIGFFTLFLAGSGWVWGMRMQPEKRLLRGRYMGYFGVLSAVFMYYETFCHGPINIILMVFATILLGMAANDALRKGLPKSHIVLHGGRMGGAYIAASTAFLVVNIPPEWGINEIWVWLAPTIVGSPLIAIALRKWSNPSKAI